MIGQVVGQYRIIEKLGEGGMGAVYKGIDLMVEREVAIKMLRPEIARQPELVERFRSEAITLAKLNYPGIATLYNFFRQGDDFFMVMEFVSGRTLDSIIRESGAMPWDRAVPLFCRILEAIQPAHQSGILHRDIKPSNIMLTAWGGVKVMDFGIARVLGSARLTREGRMVGTIEYIAPERIKGSEADTRADIYSLGVVLYEMLTGHLPFESDSEFEIMRGHVQEPPPPFTKFIPHVPPPVEEVVILSLAKPVEQRIQSCGAFLAALQNATHGLMPSGDSSFYAAALPVNPAPSQTGPVHTQAMDYVKANRFTDPAAAAASAGHGGTGEGKATRFEPQPATVPLYQPPQYQPPGMPVSQSWTQPGAPISNQYAQPVVAAVPPTAPADPPTKSGFLAQMTWKHYAAAGGALFVLIFIVALLALSKPKPASVEQNTGIAPAANVAPASTQQPQEPVTTPTSSPTAAPAQPDSAAAAPAPVDVVPAQAAPDDAEKARAKASGAKKRADALKALDEQ